MHQNQPISKATAIKRMRELTENNIPFSFGFISCNTTNQSSKGYVYVGKALLRSGLRSSQSDKSNILIAYTNYESTEDKPRHFYYPLLMMFNGQKVQP